MRFLMLYRPANTSIERGVPPSAEQIADMEKFIAQSAKDGWLLDAEGCQPSSEGARVRMAGTKVSATDGPFSEAKEVIGGLIIIKADSKADAIAHATRFLKVAGDGEVELRPLFDGPPSAKKGV
jgi:hypothetical protein